LQVTQLLTLLANEAYSAKDAMAMLGLSDIKNFKRLYLQPAIEHNCMPNDHLCQFRALFDQEHPEYQILNWDCGWYQIKGLLLSQANIRNPRQTSNTASLKVNCISRKYSYICRV